MAYRNEMLQNKDSFDGCAGLEEVHSFEEWIDFEARLKAKYKDEYVPSEVFLAVRQQDNYVVGIMIFDTLYLTFFSIMGGILGIVSVHRNARKGMHLKCLN